MAAMAYLGQGLAAIVFAGGVAAVLGALSRTYFVVGLLPVASGMAAGAAVLGVGLWLRGEPGRAGLLLAGLGVLVAWVVFQVAEDHHFRTLYVEDLTAARAAASGVGAGAIPAGDEIAFYAPDAEARLRESVQEAVGFNGPVARWWLRAQSGVRILGPWTGGRGLPVGPWGRVVFTPVEWALGLWVARRVLTFRSPTDRSA